MAPPRMAHDALAVAVWGCVGVFLAPLERACVRRACGRLEIPLGWRLAHVADSHDGDGAELARTEMAVTIDPTTYDVTAMALPAAVAASQGGGGQLVWHCHPPTDGLTCGLYGCAGPTGEPCARWTHLLLLLTAPAVAVDRGPPPPPLAPPPPTGHFRSYATEMSARQIVPQAETAGGARHDAKPPHAVVSSSSSSSSSSSTLAMLFQRLAIARRRRAQLKQQQSETQQRASWPCVRADFRAKPSLARRAQQSIAHALASLQRGAPASVSLAPPQFVLRTQRRLSQRFNHKIVRAVGKDVRRSESQRRSSLTLFEASSCSDADEPDADEFPLRISERLSLSLGRRISRDFAPMLTEGSALECRVRELVYGLLRDAAALEGHVCARFFARQEAFTSPLPAACRFYLARVRDTVTDLVEFIVEYRLRELGDEFVPFFDGVGDDDDHNNQHGDHASSVAFAHELETAVRRAVEEYFVFSLRYEIRQWSAGAASVATRSERALFRKTLARWSELPPTSAAFGLKTKDPQLAAQPLVATAIAKLQELETIATPSRQMENLLAACHALGAFLAQSRASFSGATSAAPPLSPSARVCLGDADSFLPLLIFAVSRSALRDAFSLCASLHGLFPFASQHGERMYYLTMFEAALEFMRTAPSSCC